ncbi:MAG: trypsin-like peptidase domain-containing protein [Clostridia bacterium]|nr:trypsin-like peptidase domain-containing protein [Clostridia bacterium]
MNNINAPENFGENHIREIKEPEKRKKREKPRFSLTTFIVTIIVSVIVSTVSGAVGALVIYPVLIPGEVPTEENNEFVIEEQSTAAAVNTELTTGEEITERAEENTFMPPESTPEVPVSPVPENTTAPAESALSKGEIYAEAVNSVVTITASWKQYYSSILGSYYRPATSSGTGFAVTDNGYIVTNNHVVENAEELTVTDYNGKEYKAKVVGTVPENDFAVIKINAETEPVVLGNSSDLNVGDDIMVIGNALGELSYTFTDGIISHLSRSVTVETGTVINMFQTNAAINNGNSGGPVYNMDGEVVGIASAKYASDKIEGLGFCIPIDDVKTMMSDIIVYGYIKGKPSLGITIQTVTAAIASRYSIPQGCYVVALDKDSPCYEAGIRSGDVITKIGSKSVNSTDTAVSILSDKKAGGKISITYYSSGESHTVNITLAEKKPRDPRTQYTNVIDI